MSSADGVGGPKIESVPIHISDMLKMKEVKRKGLFGPRLVEVTNKKGDPVTFTFDQAINGLNTSIKLYEEMHKKGQLTEENYKELEQLQVIRASLGKQTIFGAILHFINGKTEERNKVMEGIKQSIETMRSSYETISDENEDKQKAEIKREQLKLSLESSEKQYKEMEPSLEEDEAEALESALKSCKNDMEFKDADHADSKELEKQNEAFDKKLVDLRDKLSGYQKEINNKFIESQLTKDLEIPPDGNDSPKLGK